MVNTRANASENIPSNTTANSSRSSQLWSSGVLLRLCTCCVSILDNFGGQVGEVSQSRVLGPENRVKNIKFSGSNRHPWSNPIKVKPGFVLGTCSCELRMTKAHQELLCKGDHLNKHSQQVSTSEGHARAPVRGGRLSRNARRESTTDLGQQSLHLQLVQQRDCGNI